MKHCNNNCYSKLEMGFMVRGQNIRAKILKPLLQYVKEKGVTPDHITILSLISGILGALLIGSANEIALLMIFLHVAFDGIDGPLARYTKTDSNKGTFTDTACDQIVIAVIAFSLIDAAIITPLSGGVYVLLYTVVVGFSMVRNAMGIPYAWLIRPRFLLYLWLPVEFYLVGGYTTYILWFFSGILLYKSITGYFSIRKVI